MASIIPFTTKTKAQNFNYSVVTEKDDFTSNIGRVYLNSGDLDQLQGNEANASYDLRVGDQYFDIRKVDTSFAVPEGGFITIKPHQAIIITTMEEFMFPNTLFGVIYPRVSMLEKGLANICSKIDPGFSGQLRITVFNLGSLPIKLQRGERFCSLALHNVDSSYRLVPYTSATRALHGNRKVSPIKRFTSYCIDHPTVITASIAIIISIISLITR